MVGTYLGQVSEDDPLYGYLKYDIQPQVSDFRENAAYNVYGLNGSNLVYLYEEIGTGTRVIGKYFYSEREEDRDIAAAHLKNEYENLEKIRSFGFDEPPFYVAKPLGRNPDLNELLVVEFCEGELLSNIITRAIAEKNDALLFDKLKALAHFMAAFHNRTALDAPVDFNQGCDYMDRVVFQCNRFLTDEDGAEFDALRDAWREHSEMWEDCQVMVHGDATPANFMFGDDDNVCTFDLERVLYSDRIFDMGRFAGELMHFFLMKTGNKYAAEPFIGHFLWEYASCFPDREQTFASITQRVPFYMGTTLLRIARNLWLDQDYCRNLVFEAKNCFKEVES